MSVNTVNRLFIGRQSRAFVQCRGLRDDGLGWEYGRPEKRGKTALDTAYYINGLRVEARTIGEYTGATYRGQKIYEDDFIVIPSSDDVFLVYFDLQGKKPIIDLIRDNLSIGRFAIRSLEGKRSFSYAAVVVGNIWEDAPIVMPAWALCTTRRGGKENERL